MKKEDVGVGKLLTIGRIAQENVAQEGQPQENKCIVYWVEAEKPMVLNATNAQIIADITGIEDNIEHNWPNTRVVVFNDHNIMFKGKLTGGIRVRAPKQQTGQQQAPGFSQAVQPQAVTPPPYQAPLGTTQPMPQPQQQAPAEPIPLGPAGPAMPEDDGLPF